MRNICFATALVLALAGGIACAQSAGDALSDPPTGTPVTDGVDPATAVDDPVGAPSPTGGVVPPVKDRHAEAGQKIAVRGFRVTGVADHGKLGVTPESIQALADARFRKMAGEDGQAELGFDEMQSVADEIVERYRTAGFIVSNAFLPAQTIGDDKIVTIEVLEGQIGKIIVKGNRRYRPGVISASAEKLRGKPLQKGDVDTALMYAHDLPGVTVSSTFQPGENTGDTDLVMVANEAKRPYKFTLGANNYGTELTGRYRLEAGLEWDNPFRLGDMFKASVDYALDPNDNIYGSLIYQAPIVRVPGLSVVAGASRNELQINSGTFAALDVKGPTTLYYGGLDWKFINRDGLESVATLHVSREQSRLDSLGMRLSDQKFTVAELGYQLLHTDRRFHGVNILQAGLRQSLSDDSAEPDLVSPAHASKFLVARLAYTRMQFLTKSQRLDFKLVGQYSRDALVPLEQLALGGPDSVRAYPIADALRDRGYYASLEYHTYAPGFGDVASPFYGRPWRELLEFQVFVDYAKGFAAGANRGPGSKGIEYSGAGAGLIFRLPRFKHFEFHLDGAVPLGSVKSSDGKDFHIYSKFSFTF